LKHEFSTIEGLREDVLEVLLNLKDIIFKSSFLKATKDGSKLKGFLNVKGPLIVTAGMFNLPKNSVRILNPDQYIGTIVDTSEFYMEIDIENGKGYQLIDENRKKAGYKNSKVYSSKPSTLFVDALFMPIKRVNYKIKLIHDTKGNIKESLNLEIWTNQSITPKRSLQEALKILMNLFYTLFLTPDFLSISSKISKKFLPNLKKVIINK
jgi:DNA-directed RNA polymerase subunit alpha